VSFGEHVEGRSHFRDENCADGASSSTDDFENSKLGVVSAANQDQGFFCQIREVDGVPQNGEVAAMSPNSVRWSDQCAQRPGVRRFHRPPAKPEQMIHGLSEQLLPCRFRNGDHGRMFQPPFDGNGIEAFAQRGHPAYQADAVLPLHFFFHNGWDRKNPHADRTEHLEHSAVGEFAANQWLNALGLKPLVQ
jgi:hypothetical protein